MEKRYLPTVHQNGTNKDLAEICSRGVSSRHPCYAHCVVNYDLERTKNFRISWSFFKNRFPAITEGTYHVTLVDINGNSFEGSIVVSNNPVIRSAWNLLLQEWHLELGNVAIFEVPSIHEFIVTFYQKMDDGSIQKIVNKATTHPTQQLAGQTSQVAVALDPVEAPTLQCEDDEPERTCVRRSERIRGKQAAMAEANQLGSALPPTQREQPPAATQREDDQVEPILGQPELPPDSIGAQAAPPVAVQNAARALERADLRSRAELLLFTYPFFIALDPLEEIFHSRIEVFMRNLLQHLREPSEQSPRNRSSHGSAHPHDSD